MRNASLEKCGSMICNTEYSVEQVKAISEEIANRCDNDRDKANCLMDFHVTKFQKNPTSWAWCELVAMMAGVQHIHNHKTERIA